MSEAATSPAIPAEPTPLVSDKLADFSDKLSPMLVKELRQGLRARTFVIVFLLLQGLLGLVLLASIGSSRSPQDAGHHISGIIFMFFSMAVLVIQPVRGIGTLHREIQGNTIELMVLTRLSAWKIVLGKWISIVAQSALLLAAVVPYLILRYWFGDMNLFGELTLLALVFLLSTVATAVIVGISCVPSVILRGLVPLISAAVAFIWIPEMCFGYDFEKLVQLASLQTRTDRWGVAAFVLSSGYIGWTALGLGASLIAPAAENHSTLKRVVTLGLLILALLVSLATKPGVYYLISIALVLGIPSIVMALNEPITLMSPHCRPFLKKGLPGRLAGRFLYPGWPSGVMFAACFTGLAIVMIRYGGSRNLTTDETIVLTAVLGSILMPAAVMSFFEKKIRNRFTLYLLLLVAQFIVVMVLTYIGDAMPRDQRGFIWLFSWLPMMMVSMAEMSRSFATSTVWNVTFWVCVTYGVILLINALRQFRRIREVEFECQEQMNRET